MMDDERTRPRGGTDRTFTRLSVVTPVRSVDLAVPDDMTGADLVRVVSAEVGLPPTQRVVLEHPVHGFWPSEGTPRDLGVLDGEVLNLRPLAEQEIPRPVDDVSESVAAATGAAEGWTTGATRLTFAVVLGAWCAGAAVLSGTIRPIEARPFVLAMCLLVLLVTAILAGRLERRVEGTVVQAFVVATAGYSAWVLSGQFAWMRLDRVAVTAVALGAAVAVVGLIDPARAHLTRPVGLGLVAATPAVLVARLTPPSWGWSPEEVAAVVAVVSAVGLGLVTKLALGTSGLLRLDTDSAEGYPVDHRELDRSVERAAADITALLVGLTVPAAVAVVVLLGGHTWALVTGLATALVLASRARGYRRAEHVGVMLVAPVAALCAAALTAAVSAPSSPLAPVVLVGGVPLAMASLYVARDIQEARFKVWLDRLEIAALVALVPLVLAVFEVYTLVYDRFS